jgi:tRNA(fMet)-specific endonuclease VapC
VTVYLLDTDTFSEYLNEDTLPESEAPITRRIAALTPGQVIICAVTLAEVMRGMLNLLQRMEKADKDAVGYAALVRADYGIHRFFIAPYSDAAHAHFLGFTPAVRRLGRPDCQIAAIALANNYIVVTRNTRHFSQIPGVLFEDWTRPSMEPPPL